MVPFLDIMEYTGNDMISDIPLTTSLLKMFSMFRVKITVRDDNVDEVSFLFQTWKTYSIMRLSEEYHLSCHFQYIP